MSDSKRDEPVPGPKIADPLWVISHVFPKWLYGAMVAVGLLIGWTVAWRFNAKMSRACLAAVAAALASFIATSEVDRRLLLSRTRRDAAPSLEPPGNDEAPISFGYKTAWIAVPSEDGREVARVLGLERMNQYSWKAGLENAYSHRGVFVTPPIGRWTIAVGALPDAGDSRFVPMLESLSRTFHRAFYFGTHRVVEYQAWAIAEAGQISRAFAWVGDRGEFLLNIGERTPEEVELGTGLEDFENAPNEETVLELASRWVLDPRTLAERSDACGDGWFGSLAAR